MYQLDCGLAAESAHPLRMLGRLIFKHFPPTLDDIVISRQFFVTYILFASIALLNVIIAVLIDQYTSYQHEEDAARRQEELRRSRLESVDGMLDPLLSNLTTFEDHEDLTHIIDELYRVLDEDDRCVRARLRRERGMRERDGGAIRRRRAISGRSGYPG
jgi:hypothetical protein